LAKQTNFFRQFVEIKLINYLVSSIFSFYLMTLVSRHNNQY